MYLDEEMARLLAAESRRRRTTVSALVRDAVVKEYGRSSPEDRGAIIDRLAGVWADRTNVESTGAMVRRLRRSTRPERWTGMPKGATGGKVPSRQ